MSTGIVKTWIEYRGFGFVQPDEGGSDVSFMRNPSSAPRLLVFVVWCCKCLKGAMNRHGRLSIHLIGAGERVAGTSSPVRSPSGQGNLRLVSSGVRG